MKLLRGENIKRVFRGREKKEKEKKDNESADSLAAFT